MNFNNLSGKDKKVLDRIMSDLSISGKDVSISNIYFHPDFKLLSVARNIKNLTGANVEQDPGDKNTFTIRIEGSGIDLEKEDHRQIITNIIPSLIKMLKQTVEVFSMVDDIVDQEAKPFPDLIKDILSGSQN